MGHRWFHTSIYTGHHIDDIYGCMCPSHLDLLCNIYYIYSSPKSLAQSLVCSGHARSNCWMRKNEQFAYRKHHERMQVRCQGHSADSLNFGLQRSTCWLAPCPCQVGAWLIICAHKMSVLMEAVIFLPFSLEPFKSPIVVFTLTRPLSSRHKYDLQPRQPDFSVFQALQTPHGQHGTDKRPFPR